MAMQNAPVDGIVETKANTLFIYGVIVLHLLLDLVRIACHADDDDGPLHPWHRIHTYDFAVTAFWMRCRRPLHKCQAQNSQYTEALSLHRKYN